MKRIDKLVTKREKKCCSVSEGIKKDMNLYVWGEDSDFNKWHRQVRWES